MYKEKKNKRVYSFIFVVGIFWNVFMSVVNLFRTRNRRDQPQCVLGVWPRTSRKRICPCGDKNKNL